MAMDDYQVARVMNTPSNEHIYEKNSGNKRNLEFLSGSTTGLFKELCAVRI